VSPIPRIDAEFFGGIVLLPVVFGFGIMSAVGGLTGALLYAGFATPALTRIFGVILLFAGFMGATGLAQKMRFHSVGAWLAGGLSGALV
jgi:hypothetical protein